MFKKIVSNLPFSPALVGQLGPYSKKLRKEKTTRRLGLIFVALALVVQSFALFQPPESANAYDPANNIAKESDQSTNNDLAKSVVSASTSQGFVDATSVTAYASDQISYTITVQNVGTTTVSTKIENSLSDVLEYSLLADSGGGTLDKTTNILSWPDVTLAPNTKQTRTFIIRLLDTIPATAQGTDNKKSYDCIMTNTFGNSIDIRVDCPVIKTIENIVTELPSAGITENLILAVAVLSVTIYFYARTRQLEKEIHLIRKDASTGTI